MVLFDIAENARQRVPTPIAEEPYGLSLRGKIPSEGVNGSDALIKSRARALAAGLVLDGAASVGPRRMPPASAKCGHSRR